MLKPLKLVIPFVAFMLAACSDDNDANQENQVQQQILSSEELTALYGAGDFASVVEAVRYKEQQEVATTEDFILMARAYNAQLDGIGASIALDKISAEERGSDEYVILDAQARMLEGPLQNAARVLAQHNFSAEYAYQAALMEGDIAFLLQQNEEAIAYYNEAIQLDDQQFAAFVARAQAHLKLADADAAEADAKRAIDLSSENTVAHYALGAAYNMQGEQDAAKEQFERAIKLFPRNVPAMLELAGIHILRAENTEAESYLDRVYAEQPENSTARFFTAMLLALKGEDENARDELQALVINNNDNPQLARLWGHVAYRLKDYNVARNRLEMVVRKAPFDRASRIVLAEIYILDQTPAKALTLLNPLLNDDSNDLAAFSMASLAAAQVNDLDKAIAYTRKTIALTENPEIAESGIDDDAVKVMKRRLASYQAANGNADQATSILESLIAEDARDATSQLLLSNIQVQSGNYAAAFNTAERMIEQNPDAAAGYNARATAQHRQGQLDAALASYDQAILLNNEYTSALKNRAALYLQQQMFEEARVDLSKVLDATPNDARAQLMYTRALLETGRATEALGYFNGLESVFRGSVQVLMFHARALADTGDYTRALSKLTTARQLPGAATPEILAYIDAKKQEYQLAFEAERAKITGPRSEEQGPEAEDDQPKGPNENEKAAAQGSI